MSDLDQKRASSLFEKVGPSLTAVGDEILFSDLVLPQLQDKHYILESLILIGRCVTRKPLEPPVSGLFLVDPSTPAPEAVWVPLSRGFPIPLSACYCCEVALGTQFAIAYVAQPGYKLTIPRGYVIRGVIQCEDSTATPGPGVGSTLLMRALMLEELDCPLAGEAH